MYLILILAGVIVLAIASVCLKYLIKDSQLNG